MKHKIMLAILIAAVLPLGCENERRDGVNREILICTLKGEETFRSDPSWFWRYWSAEEGGGYWQGVSPDAAYQPAVGEYCKAVDIRITK